MMANENKCAVLVPIGWHLEPETEDQLRALADRGYMVRLLRGSSQVDLARSSLATEALRDGFEETMWIDADTSFNPDDVDKLRSFNLPFVAGFYPCKGPKRFAGKLLPESGKVTFGKGGGLIVVEYVGMGFTFIRREVYDAIWMKGMLGNKPATGGYGGKDVKPYFIPMVDNGVGTGDYLSEDFSFCRRAAWAGYVPFVDTRIKVGHIGKYTYTWDDLVERAAVETLVVESKATGQIEAVS